MQLSQHEVRARITQAMQGPEPGATEFSLARALRTMYDSKGLFKHSSHEGEVCAVAAEAEGDQHDPCRIRVPLRYLARDLTATGSALVGSTTTAASHPLRPYSVTLQAGANVQTGLRDNSLTPRITSDPTAVWLATESASATEGAITFGQLALTPKSVSAYVEVSRQLLLQGLGLNSVLSTSLLRACGIALDRAALVGSGSSGQPSGVSITPGIGTASGTSLAWSGVLSARASAVQACGSDQNISWIGGSVAQRVLAGRERAAGSGFIWGYSSTGLDGEIAGHRAFATAACPSDALFLADWGQLLIGLWGDSVTIEMNPFANFQAGIVGFRVVLPCDVSVTAPAYFSSIESIT